MMIKPPQYEGSPRLEGKRAVRRSPSAKAIAKLQPNQPRPTESVILLKWKDREANGYTDVLPAEWFSKPGARCDVVHAVWGPEGKEYAARCNVTVQELEAKLDYEPYATFNLEQGMLLGVAALRFMDADRTAIASVQWKRKRSKAFISCPFDSPQFLVPPDPPYVAPLQTAARTPRPVRERPGQAAFRRKLKLVYGHRCCISGYAVPEALAGAHIDPYTAPASDNICNGLLLRSDLHTLFDHYLIAIDPESLLVHVAERARGTTDYGQWQGTKVRLPVEPAHHPDQGALRRRWHYTAINHNDG